MATKSKGYKPWPDNDQPARFRDIADPIRAAIEFAYKLERQNKNRSIPWNGLDIGKTEQAGCFRPKQQLARMNLKISLEDQGRDALDEIIRICIQLGIEQGRRLERSATEHDILAILLKSMGLNIIQLQELLDDATKQLKAPSIRGD